MSNAVLKAFEIAPKGTYSFNSFGVGYEAGVVAERERCAKIAENFPDRILVVYNRGPNDPPGNGWAEVKGQKLIADAIRQ